jgi:hypothetical protein
VTGVALPGGDSWVALVLSYRESIPEHLGAPHDDTRQPHAFDGHGLKRREHRHKLLTTPLQNCKCNLHHIVNFKPATNDAQSM